MNSWFYLILDTSESIRRECKAIVQLLIAKPDISLKVLKANISINPLYENVNSSVNVGQSKIIINVSGLKLGLK